MTALLRKNALHLLICSSLLLYVHERLHQLCLASCEQGQIYRGGFRPQTPHTAQNCLSVCGGDGYQRSGPQNLSRPPRQPPSLQLLSPTIISVFLFLTSLFLFFQFGDFCLLQLDVKMCRQLSCCGRRSRRWNSLTD